jgi:hypothetical protein
LSVGAVWVSGAPVAKPIPKISLDRLSDHIPCRHDV